MDRDVDITKDCHLECNARVLFVRSSSAQSCYQNLKVSPLLLFAGSSCRTWMHPNSTTSQMYRTAENLGIVEPDTIDMRYWDVVMDRH